jgi:hypothetical protein
MKINAVAFGNKEEAFIENRLSYGVNVIYSDDNNKGKTLLMQGMMYSLGNTPIFPSGFDYNNYYFYTNITLNGKIYEFMRRRNTITVKSKEIFQICDSVSELKYFIDVNIFELPKILKNEEEQIADMSLFYQIFFVGQDKRNTSNIINSGRYNKKDFINMLYYLNGYPNIQESKLDDEEEKALISRLKNEAKTIKKLMKFTKNNPNLAEFANKTSDRERLKAQAKKINEIQKNISNYENSRRRELNRKIKLKYLINELNSLNREINQGKVTCAKCGSKQIVYSNKDIKFEISNRNVRNRILHSIEMQIKMKNEIIDEYTECINMEQSRLKNEMRNIPVEIMDILIYSQDILKDEEYDNRLIEIENQLTEIQRNKSTRLDQDTRASQKNQTMIKTVIEKMNTYYRNVDPNGNLYFDSLFTKKDETYSGSEEQEYYYSRIMALNDYFKHPFPLIIDAFRSGELSTKKEKIMLDNYINLNKQVILTATLKDEEYDKDKYKDLENVLALDYSYNEDSKILQSQYVEEFSRLIKAFNIIAE